MTSLQGAYPPVFRLERSPADCNFVIRKIGYCCIVKGIPASTCFWLGFLTSSIEHSDIRILALGLTSLRSRVSAAQWCGAGQGRYVGPARWVMKVNKRVRAQDVLLCRASLMKTNQSLHILISCNQNFCHGSRSSFKSAEAKFLVCPSAKLRVKTPDIMGHLLVGNAIWFNSLNYPF